MPFVHLERELWDLRDATGNEIAPDAPERRGWLLDRGAIGRLRPPVEQLLEDPATLAAAARHVRWHSQQGPDEITNALALCALHHALFDLGVLGITEDRRIRVSSLYVARNEAGQAVDSLAGKPLLTPRPHQPTVDIVYISWHHRQVFKGALRI
jgi:hypothetical protein